MAHERKSDVRAPLPLRGQPGRIVFLDALRLLAAVQMVQGHSLDALLAGTYRSGAGFAFWSFTRGLTSTAFLVAAGLSFAVVSADRPSFTVGRPRRVRRALMLVALGYLMHAPFGLMFGQTKADAWAEVGIVDVLQCIGVGLLLLEALTLATAQGPARAAWAIATCGFMFVATPYCDGINPQGWARPLLHYVTARGGSVFPLVPWLGFMGAGFAVGLAALPGGVGTPRARQLAGLSLAAAAVLLASALAYFGFGSVDARLGFAFLALKLGIVLLVASALAWALLRVPRLPALWTRLAGETLFLYFSHVVILYAAGVGLGARIGRTQPLTVCLAVAFVLLAACSAGAVAYRTLRKALRLR